LFLKTNAATIDISVSGFARDARNGMVQSLSETAKTNLVEKKIILVQYPSVSVECDFRFRGGREVIPV
jgi:hypothetical protein